MSYSTKSKLETLPNELFFYVFRYINAKDLRNFKGLNKRIDSIVDDVQINLDFVNNNDTRELLSVFSPSQVIRFEMKWSCEFIEFNTMQNLRSFTIDYSCKSDRQWKIFLEDLYLPNLEWLSIRHAASDQAATLLEIIAANRQFPSLVSFSMRKGRKTYFNCRLTDRWSNETLRSFSLEEFDAANFYTILRTFLKLNRLEINLDGSLATTNNSSVSNLSLNHIRVTLTDPVSDLEYLLKAVPNLKRLRLRGSLGSNNVINQFEQIANFLSRLASDLIKLNCELYCYGSDRYDTLSIIKQLHPLFNKIQCLVGPDENRCYATDLDIYPDGNEYQRNIPRPHYSSLISCTYYDDDDDDEYHGHEYNDDYVGGWEEDYEHRDMYWDAEADDWCPLP